MSRMKVDKYSPISIILYHLSNILILGSIRLFTRSSVIVRLVIVIGIDIVGLLYVN